jgi:hypothetical protein
MENKNNSSISNKMSLIETYYQSLNEDLISKAALEGKLIASELEGYLKMMTKDSKVGAELTKAGIRTSEELLAALKGNRLTSTLKGSLELSILKSNTKNTKLIDLASENLVRNKAFDQKYAAEFAKGQPAYEKALKQAGYSEDAITKIVQKKFNLPTPKPTAPKPTTPKPTPPKPLKSWWEKWRTQFEPFLKNKPNWKEIVKWGAGLGISAAALWWMVDTFASDKKGDDFPPVPPVDTAWAPCIQELLKSKEGVISQTSNGQISVIVKPTDFPGGVQFYNNGRVMDVVGKKMGTWKCKGTKAVIAETQKIKLGGLLNEQSSEIDVTTFTDYVDSAILNLDGFVGNDNLITLGNIFKNLNGKTFQGKNAISQFLSFYKKQEGAEFIDDVNSVGTKRLGTAAVVAKDRIVALAKGGGTVPPVPTNGKKGITGIDITWDGQKKSDEKVIKPIKKSRYHDCSGKDTFEFGCKSPKIREIQKCLGMEERYQTGNFGPLTKKALEDMSYDTSKGITVEMYNRIKSTCTDDSNKPRLDGSIEPLKTNLTPKSAPVNADNLKLPNLQPVGQGNRGESIYKGLKNNYGDGTNPEMPYIFSSGGRIKYKGDDDLGGDVLGQLDQYIGTLGYQRIKEKDKDYGVKYVWAKQ